jgi:hypothetical protein
LQGGAIGIFSDDNIGSTFAFFVSARLTEPPPDHRNDSLVKKQPRSHQASSYANAMRAVKLNVLLVEDNLVNQKVLMKQLQKCGWTISVAGNGQEALEWLKGSVYWRGDHDVNQNEDKDQNSNDGTPNKLKQQLDIILMDVEMPIM